MKDSVLIQMVVDSLPPMAISLFGGFVSLFTGRRRFSVRLFIGGLLAAILVGLVLNLLLLEMGTSDTTRAVTLIVGGYSANTVLDALSKKFLAPFIGDKKEEDKNDDC